MASYTCIPSTTTVYPCPSGTAPASVVVESAAAPQHVGVFDTLPVQDIVFGASLVFAFLIGLGQGRR